MRKNIRSKKRVLAMALACSMLFGEVGAHIATVSATELPDEDTAVEETVETAEEEIAPDTYDTAEETTEEEIAPDTCDTAEETEETTEEEITPDTYDTASAKPAAVANLRFDEKTNGILDTSMLSWDAVQGAEGYEIRAVDAAGIEYARWVNNEYDPAADQTKQVLSYVYTTHLSYDLDKLIGRTGYTIAADGSISEAKDAAGKNINVSGGGSYAIYVRAYSSKTAGEDASPTAYGDWSAPITYTMPAATTPAAITNIKIDNKGRLTFNKGAEDSVAIEIKTADAAGNVQEFFYTVRMENGQRVNTYVSVESGNTLNESSFKLRAYVYEASADGTYFVAAEEADPASTTGGKRYITPFRAGQTYTIRLAGVNRTTGAEVFSAWSEPIAYTAPAVTAPEATGNVKYVPAEKIVTWNSVKDAGGYELDIMDAAGNRYYKGRGFKYVDGKYIYYPVNYDTYGTELDLTDKYYSYVLDANGNIVKDADGDPTYVTDAAGERIYAFQKGGTYTVSVRAYNKDEKGQRIYSAPAACTFTVSQIPKVTNVNIFNGTLKWKAVEDAYQVYNNYQIEIKDAEGRLYYSSKPQAVTGVDGAVTYDWDSALCELTGGSAGGTASKSLGDISAWTYIEDRDADGKLVGYIPLKHEASGSSVKAFEPGKTYSVRVRTYGYSDGKRVYGEWSDAVTYTMSNRKSPVGVQNAPAKVTGLVIETEDVDSPRICWNGIDQTAAYELEIKDSKGNSYTEYPTYINNAYETQYYRTGGGGRSSIMGMYLSNLSGLKSYINNPGSALDTVKNAAGEDARTFEPGETYTIRVRAINTYKVWDVARQDWSSVDYYYGEWSNSVTYKPAASTALTGLQFVKYEKGRYYFTYTAKIYNSKIYYQIATDQNFNAASMVLDWDDFSVGSGDLLRIDADDLENSRTYYIRAVNYPRSAKDFYSLTAEEIAALNPAVTAFTTIGRKTPKNITGLKLYWENAERFEFRFDAVLKDEDGDKYELQAANDPNGTGWVTVGEDSTTVYKSSLNEGTTYIRAVAYVEQTNEATGKTEKVYGTPSNVVSVNKNYATSQIGKLSLKSKTSSAFTFTYTGKVDKQQKVMAEWSDSKNFDTNGKADTHIGSLSGDDDNRVFSLYYTQLTPGKKYYVRVRVYNSNAKSTAEEYSAYSNVVTVSTVVPKVTVDCASATKKSVTLKMSTANNDSYLTGYEIQRKDGKKWKDIARITSQAYTDKKLKADTTYTYRVRAYYFDAKTKKTKNGSWEYTEATTWTGAIKPIAKAAGKTSVKLTWSAVPGAKGYEIYRRIGNHETTEVANGRGNGSSQYKLVKSVGAKTKSYKDKGLTANMGYTYKIVAYKTIDGKKVTIDAYTSVSLAFELSSISQVQKSNGKVVWTWNPVFSAKGYLVEKKDSVTGKWSTYKKIKKAKTSSVTLPKTTDMKGVTYRVRAYNGKTYTDAISCTVYPVVSTPTGVKAKASTKNKAITVSWKKVKGADYYLVYRTTDPRTVYNKDRKGYTNNNVEEVPVYVKDNTTVSGYRRISGADDLKKYFASQKTLQIVDREISYTRDGIDVTIQDGPKTGVTYYYYVVAVKNGKAYNTTTTYDGGSRRSFNSKTVSATLKLSAPAKVAKGKFKLTAAKGKVTIKVTEASAKIDGYEVFRATSKKGKYESVGVVAGKHVKGKTVSFVDKKSKKNALKKGKTYYYKVRAFVYNDAGEKVYSKVSVVKSVKAK